MITFKIGGVHPHENKIAKDAAITPLAPPAKVAISMAQHLGAPATPVVAKGDKVLVGQVIGEPSGFISGFVHSSVSGTVAAVEPRADIAGNMVPHVVIDVEGDEWDPAIDRSEDLVRKIADTPEEILAKIKAAGIVGMGGATFPTHVKLNPPPGKKAEFLIINGAECEPYVTADDRLMREKPDAIVIGAAIMAKALGGCKCMICIEENKPEAIDAIQKASTVYPDIEVLKLKKKYPQGGEKQLIDAVTGRQVPSGALPIDTGCVVQNVATSYAVYEAIQKNKPLFERVMTVTGQCVTNPRNFRVRLGTPLSFVLEAAGGVPETAAKFISGGPMMGKAGQYGCHHPDRFVLPAAAHRRADPPQTRKQLHPLRQMYGCLPDGSGALAAQQAFKGRRPVRRPGREQDFRLHRMWLLPLHLPGQHSSAGYDPYKQGRGDEDHPQSR